MLPFVTILGRSLPMYGLLGLLGFLLGLLFVILRAPRFSLSRDDAAYIYVFAALGALAGGAWQTVGHYGSRLLGKLKGARELTVNDAVLRLLALRQRQLLAALQTRGHAAVEAIRLETPEDKQWREGKLPEALRKARAHPEWSSLNGRRVGGSDRQEQIDALAELLESGRGE